MAQSSIRAVEQPGPAVDVSNDDIDHDCRPSTTEPSSDASLPALRLVATNSPASSSKVHTMTSVSGQPNVRRPFMPTSVTDIAIFRNATRIAEK